ncbi:hypothetical protein PoB_006156100 [Plakobranchus ocellatus]|uniref:Uncharacterized protein n=1 Tax=Plakobranchus ocellatus TaxID=259542 RepID=A0AAV4CTM4_9GAST|nr:hypothetical protein PoB_006156100 [Plakobranchus ocellatus]
MGRKFKRLGGHRNRRGTQTGGTCCRVIRGEPPDVKSEGYLIVINGEPPDETVFDDYTAPGLPTLPPFVHEEKEEEENEEEEEEGDEEEEEYKEGRGEGKR